MTDSEKREAARQFYYKWKDKGREDEDDRSYWLDILQRLLGAGDATDRVDFQKKVIVDGNTKRIDAYIPETKVIIEQKTLGIPLDRKIPQSGGIFLTPYEQAKRYNDNLPSSEKARWIVTSNFAEIWVYDMDTRIPEKNVIKINISDLQSHYPYLDFLLEKKVKKVTREMELSLKAGEIVGRIYDAFLSQYNDPSDKRSLASLNVLCVRLVFCLYAEDAGLFPGKTAFSDYVERYQARDLRMALISLFKVLDTPLKERADMYLDEELEAFPYCNGGLFADEEVIIPKITDGIKQTVLDAGHFDWSSISPTIFGAVFESTLNPETRRSGGMHYTSIENIHKVIDPLFLDSLKAEFVEILKGGATTARDAKLKGFQERLSTLKFLDPACGSGNFLTETYISIRRLENAVLRELFHGQMAFANDSLTPIKVGIGQFYGIEINDFAVTVAKTALWIAESQMMKETEDICHLNLEFLPLKTNAHIVEGNALRIDWESVVAREGVSYIMGNPPFVGASQMTSEQKNDAVAIFGKGKLSNSIDYVGAWYHKAAAFMQGTGIVTAFVSTNSITQGEQVAPLWNPLIEKYNVGIEFAYRTFIWDSEATLKAHVHCVIIGFSVIDSLSKGSRKRFIFDGGKEVVAENINPYIVDAPNITVASRSHPLCDVPRLTMGNKPTDDGNFILSESERDELLKADPSVADLVRRYIGGKDFLNNNEKRYCLWLKDVSPARYKHNKEIMRRLSNIREFRLKSSAEPTKKSAETPYKFFASPQTDEPYLIIPRVSSERRRYIPMGYLSPENIASDSCSIIPGGTMYHFGVLSSNVHMAWMRTVAGRLKSDYRYSGTVVYNNFPWPQPTDEQKSRIEEAASAILDARLTFPDATLADLYDPLAMPTALSKAHRANDRAVMAAYGLDIKETTEESCVAFLMKMYRNLAKD